MLKLNLTITASTIEQIISELQEATAELKARTPDEIEDGVEYETGLTYMEVQ